MKRAVFTSLAVFVLLLRGPAQAQTIHSGEGVALRDTVSRLAAILEDEISRDEYLVSEPMNLVRLNMTRKKLSEGLKKKEPLAQGLEDRTIPDQIKEAARIVIESAREEKEIAGNIRRTHSARKDAYWTIKKNLPEKKKALEDFERWLGERGR
ncbi:MAG: hypothetical protein ACNS63_01645 [Candidatus Nitrospinota bacterium M3_3B_026]